jgi:HlyD family secretion protein
MITKGLLPLVALGLLAYTGVRLSDTHGTPSAPRSVEEPSQNPFHHALAGAGVVEARTENIPVGSPNPGIVEEVFVHAGEEVRIGQPLFRLEDRLQRAELVVCKAALDAAQAKENRLASLPRSEEVPLKEAKIRELRVQLDYFQRYVQRAQTLSATRTIAKEELERQEQAFRSTQEQLACAEADYRLLKAGAWEADKALARAESGQARANLERAEVELERLTIRALVDGQVLQVNVHLGQFVGVSSSQGLVVLGDLKKFHIRVDINEWDISRFNSGMCARAARKGGAHEQFDLDYVRTEPYVVPKQALTGRATEQVDTRVLQVIYSVNGNSGTLLVGEQLDVFLDDNMSLQEDKTERRRE